MNLESPKICILGIGAWGTTIANLLAKNGRKPIVWSHELDLIEEISKKRVNYKYLPGVELSKDILFTKEMQEIINADILIQAIPTQFVRSIFNTFDFDISQKYVVNLAKGIEQRSLYRISEILINDFGLPKQNYAVLTGPSHAEEVSKCLPTAVVVASYDNDYSIWVQKIFSNEYFRVYTSEDVIGCELGGALKNVIAIAAGIIDGLQLGDNPKAALITRGLAEITRLGKAIGANPLTFSGLSGLGDLVVTCNSRHSRNRYVGEKIGEGKSISETLSSMVAVAEGVATASSVIQLSRKFNVEMPITEMVNKILSGEIEPMMAIYELMTRKSKPEWWW